MISIVFTVAVQEKNTVLYCDSLGKQTARQAADFRCTWNLWVLSSRLFSPSSPSDSLLHGTMNSHLIQENVGSLLWWLVLVINLSGLRDVRAGQVHLCVHGDLSTGN